MTTLETVIRVAFVIINSIAFCTVCIILSKWLRRIEDKMDELKEAVYTDIARGSSAYLEFLYRYKEQLVRKGKLPHGRQDTKGNRIRNAKVARDRHKDGG